MPEIPYDHEKVELKWHERWNADANLYRTEADSTRPKYYVLEMLPYPSGEPHIGHLKVYSVGDAIAHLPWMRGSRPDPSAGTHCLPAENAAIANNRDPRDWTLSNIAAMKRQHRRMASAMTGTARSPPASPNTAGTSGSF
jgi:leucyl-tRNA synthetase